MLFQKIPGKKYFWDIIIKIAFSKFACNECDYFNCLLAMSATKVKKQPCSTPYRVTFIANPHEKDIKKIYKNSINSMVCIGKIVI